jgi:hypothetical protein
MSYTIDEIGNVLTETIEGITQPFDYSFSSVNDFIHSPETNFEELQGLCFGIAHELHKTRAAIDKHNAAQAKECQWRKGKGMCDGYIERGKRCPTCPMDDVIEIE